MREQMIQRQIVARGVTNPRVLNALRAVPRHEFVPLGVRLHAYEDTPLPIGHGQTISQPYIVALMTELLDVQPSDTVLEIGTGSGYQAAVLAHLAKEVYTIEIVKPLAESARKRLTQLGYSNISVKHGDGYLGWPEHAPFDAIIVTAAPAKLPPELIEQLREGGKMAVPVGVSFQELKLVMKKDGKVFVKDVIPVRFVPMIHGSDSPDIGHERPSP